MKIIIILIIYFITYTIELKSHELWLEAKEYQLNNNVKLIVNIKVGENFIGESYPFLNEDTEKLFINSVNRIYTLTQVDGDFPAIKQNILSSGVQYLYYQSKKEFIQYDDFNTFLDFTKKYNLNYNNDNRIPPKEIFQRFAKMIFSYNGNDFFQSETNLEFEIINQNNPFKNNFSKIKILYNFKPFKQKRFIVFFKNKNKFTSQVYQTDKNGMASIITKEKGLYLISAVYLDNSNFLNKIKYKADYHSKWASLTFKKD